MLFPSCGMVLVMRIFLQRAALSKLTQTDREKTKFLRAQAFLFAQRYQTTFLGDGDRQNRARSRSSKGERGIGIERILTGRARCLRRRWRRTRASSVPRPATVLSRGRTWELRSPELSDSALCNASNILLIDSVHSYSHPRSQFLFPLLLGLQVGIQFEQCPGCFPHIEFVGVAFLCST